MRLSLRWKILRAMTLLVVLLLGATLAIASFVGQRFVNESVTANLAQGRRRIEVVQSERIATLRLIAQNVASFSNLRAVLGTDEATLRDFLLSEVLPRNPQAALLIVLDPQGRVLARTDAPQPLPFAESANWAQQALSPQGTTGILAAHSGYYDAAAARAAAGGTIFGFVIVGARIDDSYARSLSSTGTGRLEVVLAADRVLGSTIDQPKLPWRTRPEWTLMAQNPGRHQTVGVEGETYLALPFPLGAADAPLLAVILQSRDLAFRPYRSLQWTLLGVGFAGILAAAWYSTRFSRSITAPVDKLVEGTERVAAGNFDVPVEVQSGDEIAHLADSFNSMLQGLRERVAIGKFVSQSTIKAIRKEHAVQAAGQRLELTVFFSDIRGFTEMTERRPPEDVVMILNQCLSLQADIVKKYRGDVDKFVGDCVVAHFYDQASPMDAIRCAIEIEKSLDEFNARLPEADRIDVGIGLVTGEVVLGSIGSADRRDFTAVGSNVNLASRLCSMAGAGEILLAESCYQRVQGQVAAERLAPLTVKGFRQPIPVYRINATARTTA